MGVVMSTTPPQLSLLVRPRVLGVTREAFPKIG